VELAARFYFPFTRIVLAEHHAALVARLCVAIVERS
jgi:hypothetical protein